MLCGSLASVEHAEHPSPFENKHLWPSDIAGVSQWPNVEVMTNDWLETWIPASPFRMFNNDRVELAVMEDVTLQVHK